VTLLRKETDDLHEDGLAFSQKRSYCYVHVN